MQNNKIQNSMYSVYATLFSLIFAQPVYGAELDVPLEIAIGSDSQVTGLVDYIIIVYEFIVGSIGIIAVVVIMYWGFRWVTAVGNQTIIGNAKEGIQSALIGVVIALLSFSILQFINPALVGSQDVVVPIVEFTDSASSQNVSVQNCDEIGTNFLTALPANLRAHLSWSSTSSPCLVGSSYTALVNALTELDDPTSPYYGMKLDISSAFRTSAQQQHLYSCYQAKLQNPESSGCPSYVDSQGQTRSCDGCNQAAQDGKSNHQTGYAIDAAWLPDTTITSPNATYTKLTGNRNTGWHDSCAVENKCSSADVRASLLAFDQFMQDAGFKRICIEWWHFETSSSTGSWCGVGEYK